MIRKTILLGVFVTALLLVALPMYFLQERMDEPTLAEVHNDTAEDIWIASDSAVSDVLLELGPGETGPTCLRDAGDVDVYDTDPTDETPPDPLFTLAFDSEDFCNGTYRWDGSGLSRIE